MGRGRLTPIGLDIGRRTIKAVQCAGPRSAPQIVASATLSRTDDSPLPRLEEARRLGEVLWRHGFQGRHAVVGVPESLLIAAVVEVPPPSAGAPTGQIAAAELSRLHALDPAELETDCWSLPPAGPKGQRHEAVAVGARRSDMVELLETLQAPDGTGLQAIAADAPPCARARAALLGRAAGDAWVILDLGWAASRLSVLLGGAIIYDRALPDSGMAHLELRLEQECALKPDDIRHVLGQSRAGLGRRISGAWLSAMSTYAERVAAEAKESLRYVSLHRSIAVPRTVVLTGGGAESGPVVSQLTEALDCESSPLMIRPRLRQSAAESDAGPMSGLATALGLALWAA